MVNINDLKDYWKTQTWQPGYKWEVTYDTPQYICPKCGLDDIYCRFRRAGEKLEDDILSSDGIAGTDLLRMSCRFCGYKWSEDTKEEKAKKQHEMWLESFKKD